MPHFVPRYVWTQFAEVESSCANIQLLNSVTGKLDSDNGESSTHGETPPALYVVILLNDAEHAADIDQRADDGRVALGVEQGARHEADAHSRQPQYQKHSQHCELVTVGVDDGKSSKYFWPYYQ